MDKLHLDHHISRRYNQELEDIRSKVLSMGGLVEQRVANALKSLLESNCELAETVATSDYEINALEVQIDEACTQVLALRQPTASDLRLVLAVIKTSTDLERIGDHAGNVCENVIYLVKGKDVRHTSLDKVKADLF